MGYVRAFCIECTSDPHSHGSSQNDEHHSYCRMATRRAWVRLLSGLAQRRTERLTLAMTATWLDPRLRLQLQEQQEQQLSSVPASLLPLVFRLEAAHAVLAHRRGQRALAQWRAWLARRRRAKALEAQALERVWNPKVGQMALQRLREARARAAGLRKGDAAFQRSVWRRFRSRRERVRRRKEARAEEERRAGDGYRRWALRCWRRRRHAIKAQEAAQAALVAVGEPRRRLRRGLAVLRRMARRRRALRTAAAAGHRRWRLLWALRVLRARAQARSRRRWMLRVAATAWEDGVGAKEERLVRAALCRWRRVVVAREGRRGARAVSLWAFRRWRRRAAGRRTWRAAMASVAVGHDIMTRVRRCLWRWRAWWAAAKKRRGVGARTGEAAEALARRLALQRNLAQWRRWARARRAAGRRTQQAQELATALHARTRLRASLSEWAARARGRAHMRLWLRLADRHHAREVRPRALRRWRKRARRRRILARCFAEQRAIADEARRRRLLVSRWRGALPQWHAWARGQGTTRAQDGAAAACHRLRLLARVLTAWRRQGRMRRRVGIQEEVLALWQRHRMQRFFRHWRFRKRRGVQLALLARLGDEAARCRLREDARGWRAAALQAWRAWAVERRGQAVRRRRAVLAAAVAAEGRRLRGLKRAFGRWNAWTTEVCVRKARLEMAERTQRSLALLRAVRTWRGPDVVSEAATTAATITTGPRVVVVRRRRQRGPSQEGGMDEEVAGEVEERASESSERGRVVL